MVELNFPKYEFKIKITEQKESIFDEIRKKYVTLTPEEWVRQHVITFLIQEKKFASQLIAVETKIIIHKLEKRCDVVLYNQLAKPIMIVECKAPSVKLSQKTFNQIASYNINMKVDYLLITNGLNHYCCKMDYENNNYHYLKEIPDNQIML